MPVRGTDELAQLAEAFNEMAASLEHAEQIRRQLLADVAHELRTPLATVESYVEALADGVLAADAENWGAIRSETARLNRLVNDLQRVSRAEAHQLDLHPAPTDPGELVQDAVKAARPAFATKGVALESEIQTNLPMVEVDRERIAEVLANLLTNALRHTPPGGTVQASVGQRADRIEIVVADDGEGIAAEHLDRVFERFYRIDPARARASGGTGIGLAIVRAIVEAHGGTVQASSEGAGQRRHLHRPAPDRTLASIAREPRRASEPVEVTARNGLGTRPAGTPARRIEFGLLAGRNCAGTAAAGQRASSAADLQHGAAFHHLPPCHALSSCRTQLLAGALRRSVRSAAGPCRGPCLAALPCEAAPTVLCAVCPAVRKWKSALRLTAGERAVALEVDRPTCARVGSRGCTRWPRIDHSLRGW